MFQWHQQTETRFNKNNILINLKYRHINGGEKSNVCVCVCVRACMRVWACVRSCVSVRACSCVSVRARSCVHVCPFVWTKGKGMLVNAGVCARTCVYNQTNVRPFKYLETQLNDITAISLARERSVLQLRVIFVMVSVLFKITEEGLVSKGC